MKKTIFSFFVLVGLIFNSCSQDGVSNESQNELDFSNIKIDLDESFLANKNVLFNFENKTELIERITPAFHEIIADVRKLVENDSEVSNVILDISIKEGKVTIAQIHEINIETKRVLRSVKIENVEALDDSRIGGFPFPKFDISSCPDGYTEIERCSNLGNPQNCVAGDVSSFLSSNIVGPRDCANVQVNVGTSSTVVCGANC